MNRAKLLLVEDDLSLGETLKERLEKEGYISRWAKNIRTAKEEVKNFSPDLIILDVGLPDGSGFDLAAELSKQISHPPFLFLTALAGAPERLRGFELGAEEYIPKPFHLKELLLRVKHVLGAHRHVRDAIALRRIEFNSYVIDFERLIIISPGKVEIPLSLRDAGLLQLLISEEQRVVTRDEILDKLWGEENFPTNRTIDNSIVRLRAALGKNGQNAIKSVRGAGYRWVGEKGKQDV
ncbi:MAG: response regulator transcription factor [Leptospira sp.]|nr:response regulator transcription factor [Leptospira sp.]